MESDEETQRFVEPGPSVKAERVPFQPGWRFYTLATILLVLSPVLFAFVIAWAALGTLFTMHPYILTAMSFMGICVSYILCGYTAEGVAPDTFFNNDLTFSFSSSIADQGIVAIVVLFGLVWTYALAKSQRKFCAIPFFLLGMVFTVAKLAAREDWHYAETGTAVFYSLVIAFQVALFVSVLNLWVPASPEALEDAEDMVLQLSTEGSAPAPSGHSEENPRYRRFKCAGLSTIEAPNPCTAAVGVQDRPVLVLVHGYGAGKALWTLNLDALAAHYRVYALDWLGCGLSDRPRFTAENPAEAEAFFTTAIEQWRDKMGIEDFVLVGHSVGGIIATSYSLRFPNRVKQLVLASPAGMVGPPKEQKRLHPALRIIRALWPYVTPMSLVRFCGPFGPLVLRWGVEMRTRVFPGTSALRQYPNGADKLGTYLYHNWCLEPSGENALNTLLMPGVFGRQPLTQRIGADFPVPIAFLYGDSGDWMDSRHALQLMVRLSADGKRDVTLHMISGAGHQLYLDRPHEFNDRLLNCTAIVLQDEYPTLRGLAEGHGLTTLQQDDDAASSEV